MLRNTCAAAAAATLVATSAGAATIADVFSSFWVFGDSLSDTGNVASIFPGFPPPPYDRNRLSNGPVWTEDFLDDFAPGRAANFAVAGATATPVPSPIPSFAQQVDAYEAAPKVLGSAPLAAVWFGANDMFATIEAAGAVPAEFIETVVSSAVTGAIVSLTEGVSRLVGSGIGTVALFNLPDLGLTPRIAAEGSDAQLLASGVTSAFNAALASFSEGLEASGVEVIEVDIEALFEAAIADPGAFGLTNVTDACLPVEPFSILLGADIPAACGTPGSYLFWDVLHPTATGHAEIAAAFDAAAPSPVPLPAGVVLLGSGLGLLVLRRRTAV